MSISLKQLRYTKPVFNALIKEAPFHIRNIKSAIKSRFASLGLTGKILSTSEELDGFNQITAVGTVAPFIYSVNMHIPFGWYELNGQTVNGIKLKDMRGRMIKNAKSLRFNGNEGGQKEAYFLTEDYTMRSENNPKHRHAVDNYTVFHNEGGGYSGNQFGSVALQHIKPSQTLPSESFGKEAIDTQGHRHTDVPIPFNLTPSSVKVIYYIYLGV